MRNNEWNQTQQRFHSIGCYTVEMIYSAQRPCPLSRGHFILNSRLTYKVTVADTKWSLSESADEMKAMSEGREQVEVKHTNTEYTETVYLPAAGFHC